MADDPKTLVEDLDELAEKIAREKIRVKASEQEAWYWANRFCRFDDDDDE